MAEWERARLPVQGHPQLLQAGDVTSAGTPPIIRLNTQRARVVTKTRGVFTGGARARCQGHPSLRGTRCAGHRLLAGRPPGRWLSSPAGGPGAGPSLRQARWGPGCKGNPSLNLTAICFP